MSESVTKNLRDGTIRILDGSTPPKVCEVVCDDGNLKFTITGPQAKEILDRGVLSHLRPGDEVPLDWSFGVKFRDFISQRAGTVSPYEVLLHVGAADAWVSTNDDGGGVFTLDLEFLIATPTDGERGQAVVIRKCYNIKSEFAEAGENDTLAFSGKAFVTAPDIQAFIGSPTPELVTATPRATPD